MIIVVVDDDRIDGCGDGDYKADDGGSWNEAVAMMIIS